MEEGGRRLRPPENTLDERAIGWWRARWALLTVVPVAVLGVPGAFIAPARPWLLIPAAALAVLGLACTALIPGWWFGVHRWEVTDEAVQVRPSAGNGGSRRCPGSRQWTRCGARWSSCADSPR